MAVEVFSDLLVNELALELDGAEQTRERVRPFSARYPAMRIEDVRFAHHSCQGIFFPCGGGT